MDDFVAALHLASDEELCQIAHILFQRGFNPFDHWTLPPVLEVQSLERGELIAKIVQRFQFLAADGMTVLRGKTNQLRYRDVLRRVFFYLQMRPQPTASTSQLESELYLHLWHRSIEKLPASERQEVQADLVRVIKTGGNPQLAALAAKGTGVLAFTTIVQPMVLHLLAKKVAWYFARYQVSREALKAGGMAIAQRLQAYVTAALAKRGMAIATAHYGLVRGIFAFMGPALWLLFLADLGWRGIATNYSRIIPVIFLVAQIRLLKGTENIS